MQGTNDRASLYVLHLVFGFFFFSLFCLGGNNIFAKLPQSCDPPASGSQVLPLQA